MIRLLAPLRGGSRAPVIAPRTGLLATCRFIAFDFARGAGIGSFRGRFLAAGATLAALLARGASRGRLRMRSVWKA